MARLGLKKSTFHKYQSRGLFKSCEAGRPIGIRRYVASRIERWARDGSPVTFGKKQAEAD
jgi:hypothetical protein